MAKIYATKDPNVSRRELEHMAQARALAGECVVLLENDGTLPLRPGKIALYGSGARNTIRGGTGSGDVNTRSDVNIQQGLENAGFTVTTGGWLDRQDVRHRKARQDYVEWIPRFAKEQGITPFLVTFSYPFQVIAPEEITDEDIAASDTDTAVYVISRTAGEGADRRVKRGDYLLYDEEKTQLEKLAKAYAKLVVVLNVGGVMDVTEIKAVDGVSALVLMTQLGNIGGDALADVLTGRVNPSGKLTDTWAKNYSDYPAADTFGSNDGNVDDEYYVEGVYVGYRYFDAFGVEPVYPFGYGKSYTQFRIEPAGVSVNGGKITVSAKVKNVGAVPGKEVAQLYVTAPEGRLRRPAQELKGYAKTGVIEPGKSETVDIIFNFEDLAAYDETVPGWVLEAGDYVLRLGSSSRDNEPVTVLCLNEGVTTLKTKKLFIDADPVKELTPPPRTLDEPGDGVPRLPVTATFLEKDEAVYSGPRQEFACGSADVLTLDDVKAGRCTVEELTSQLTVEELASLCVGALREGNSNVVGVSYFTVPGAAGETSGAAEYRGVRRLIMADGPAGVRLQPIFKTDLEGNIIKGGALLGDVSDPFDPAYDETNSYTYYQYCTAVPIGWALAQSWNVPALEEAGAMIGREMAQFGVDLWLAPALNIHRNPLCGRNFEYYSEDPLISGETAAALTRGVQTHPGKGTTIKHYAANSQEDNRYFTNSHISERAIREIYLKGFEIAVRGAAPAAIMTSYNLLNGVHTANSHDLLQAVTRDEWGYKGLIMTDWCTSQDNPDLTGYRKVIYPISASTGCVWSGNDLQMPGCEKNVTDLIDAVKSGEAIDGYKVSLADLQHAAANVIRAVLFADKR